MIEYLLLILKCHYHYVHPPSFILLNHLINFAFAFSTAFKLIFCLIIFLLFRLITVLGFLDFFLSKVILSFIKYTIFSFDINTFLTLVIYVIFKMIVILVVLLHIPYLQSRLADLIVHLFLPHPIDVQFVVFFVYYP